MSSSWSVSSASDAEVVAHDWVVDDKVADNVFRLKETLSSRMYMRAKKRSDGFPVLSGTAELKSGFGVVTELGSIFVDAEQAQKGQSSGDDCSNAVSKGHELEGRVGEITTSIGGAFQGVFNKISGGVAAGDQFAQMIAADCIFFSFDCHSRTAASFPAHFIPLTISSRSRRGRAPVVSAPPSNLPLSEFRGTLRRCAPGCTSLERFGSNRRSSCDS